MIRSASPGLRPLTNVWKPPDSMRSLGIVPSSILGIVLLASCDGAATPSPAPPSASPQPTSAPTSIAGTPGYPSSIVVLAHSGATGENSDPKQPGIEVRGNSWATGTNPDAQSLYLRILAKNPAIEGNNVNLAHGSATVQDLVVMAGQAVDLDPQPDLIVIQIMDADMVCPAEDSDYASFRTTFEEALSVLTEGAPDADVFVVSQFGSPSNVENVQPTQAERRPFGGTGPCAFIGLQGEIVQKELERLEDVIHGYEAQLEAGCERFERCHYDGGAFGRIVDQRSYWSSDFNHFSIEGHAKAAAVAWAGLRRAGIVP